MYADPSAPTVAIVPTATVAMPASAPAAAAPAVFRPCNPLLVFLLDFSVSPRSLLASLDSSPSLSRLFVRSSASFAVLSSAFCAAFESTLRTYCTTVSLAMSDPLVWGYHSRLYQDWHRRDFQPIISIKSVSETVG